MQITRRAALALFPLSAAGVVAGCGVISTTTTNGVTTVTINVPTAEAYISGVAALASTLIGFPPVGAALGLAAVQIINTVLAQINSAIPALNQAAGGSVKFTFDTTSAPAFIGALEADVSTVVKSVEAVIVGMGHAVPPQVQTYYNGLVSVANALASLLKTVAPAAATANVMPPTEALALVNIRLPE
ncbi:MAG: hypothetical protein KGL39_50815 [Patescibacteria group bacterium]|nr:hypothetical protein [Patescibacteria group bacterium]